MLEHKRLEQRGDTVQAGLPALSSGLPSKKEEEGKCPSRLFKLALHHPSDKSGFKHFGGGAGGKGREKKATVS